MENKSTLYEDIIGTGVTFPIQITTNELGKTGWYPVKGSVKLIENNIESLLLHQIGTKFREENFGTRLWECIEESNTQALNFLVREFLKEAFNEWENRIVYEESIVIRDNSKLIINFKYHIIDTPVSNTGKLEYDYNDNTLK